MKRKLFYLFALVCSMGLLVACSDDDDKVVCPVPQTEFTADNGLALTYNGAVMLGKKVTFVPDAANPAKATIVLTNNTNLSTLTRENAGQSVGAGVLPGSSVVEIPVELTINGKECSFSGTGATEFCTFSYNGKVAETSMQLNLTDVLLKNAALAGTSWAPTPKNPIHLVWTYDDNQDGKPSSLGFILNIALNMIKVDAGNGEMVNIKTMLCNVLHKITLGADGNVSAVYVDAANGGTAPVETPANVAQYIVESDTHLRLFLNMDAIAASLNRMNPTTKAVDMNAILEQAMSTLIPLMYEGIPVAYSIGEKGEMAVFLDTELLKPLLVGIVAPLVENEEFVAMLLEAVESAGMGSMASTVKSLLDMVPVASKTAMQVEVGLNLTPAQ